jgi:hypothetical protein
MDRTDIHGYDRNTYFFTLALYKVELEEIWCPEIINMGLSGFLKSLVPEIWLFFGLGLGEKGHPINALFRIRKICG